MKYALLISQGSSAEGMHDKMLGKDTQIDTHMLVLMLCSEPRREEDAVESLLKMKEARWFGWSSH